MLEAAATGDDPVAAAVNAISHATGITPVLDSYRLQSVTRGNEALGEVSAGVRYKGVTVMGIGLATDVVEASARAWLHAINQIVAGQARVKAVVTAETP